MEEKDRENYQTPEMDIGDFFKCIFCIHRHSFVEKLREYE